MALSTRLTDTGLGVRAELDDHDTQLAQIVNQIDFENYNISEMPIYLDKTKFAKTALFTSLMILDANYTALCVPYGDGTQAFYRVDLATLAQELWFTTTVSGTPNWYCAKLLPRVATDYDYVIAFAYDLKKIYRLSTNAAVQTAFNSQELGWLRNTGIDWEPNASGATENLRPIIYAEYVLDSYSNYAAKTTVQVWRSVDRGASWTSVFTKNSRSNTSPEIYHFHCVRRDPFNAGHWYLSSGDEPSECNIWRSVDGGVNWALVNDPLYATGELQEIHRTCNMYFTADYIYWGVDGFVNEDGVGSAWVKADRNLTGDTLLITPLADVQNYVRQTIQTPYGLLLFTETRPTSTKGLIWLVKYTDLENPILINSNSDSYGDQISDYSYGNRIFLKEAGFAEYGIAPTGRSNMTVLTITKSIKI